MSRSTTWNPESYARNAPFVSDLGEPLLHLLDPKPGERILDLGCGDGNSMTFGPGDVFFAEDVTGQGHTAIPKENGCGRSLIWRTKLDRRLYFRITSSCMIECGLAAVLFSDS